MTLVPVIPETPDNDVLVERAPKAKRNVAPRNPAVADAIKAFAQYKPGQSFFVPGAKSADLHYLRRPFLRAGLNMMLREVERDEIYGVAGVRVWRLMGEFDEL